MDRISKQSDAACQDYDDDLQNAGGNQNDEGPFDRPDAAFGGRDGCINYAMGMTMRVITAPVSVRATLVTMTGVAKSKPVENVVPHLVSHRNLAISFSSLIESYP